MILLDAHTDGIGVAILARAHEHTEECASVEWDERIEIGAVSVCGLVGDQQNEAEDQADCEADIVE